MAKKGAAHPMLRIKGPGLQPRLEDLLGERYVIGRGDPTGKVHVDFTINSDPHLSRAHCQVVRSGGDSYVVENLSANGTFVNGKEIDEATVLKNKDKIEIGAETSLEYLVLLGTDRSRELEASADTGAKEKKDKEEKKKSFLQSPWFLGVVGFYGVLGLVVFAAMQTGGGAWPDPGPGPYLQHLLHDEFARPEATATAAAATEVWDRARKQHGGEMAKQGAHAYYLIQGARRALALLGRHRTLKAAEDAGDPIAVEGRRSLDELEARVGELYREARQYLASRHFREARKRFAMIQEAIPDRYIYVRQYAAHMVHELRNRK